MDDDGDKQISPSEFKKAMRDFGVNLNEGEGI